MTGAELLTDAFGRTREGVHAVVSGLDEAALAWRPAPAANSVGWLVWHLTRVQDDHVSDVAGVEQIWTAGGWADRFGLPLEPRDTGYGHDGDQVGAVRASADLLTGYHDAVFEATSRYLAGLKDADFDRIVDARWNPPVTLGVRLVSVVDDDAQHAGQAAYVRGLLKAR